ncbi:MAG: cobalamin-dependent protein, partial [Clostridiales bacterium]|nr:cobalamin-dependent protein [Clostridiales bacterium]
MKTILLAVNAKYIHTALAPWLLKDAIRRADIQPEPEVMEAHVNQPVTAVLQTVAEANPDILGVGCYIWNILWIQELLEGIRLRLPGCTVILGGPEVSFDSAQRLRVLPHADYVIRGEGELPFAQLLSYLYSEPEALPQDRGRALHHIPGLTWRLGEKIVQNPLRGADSQGAGGQDGGVISDPAYAALTTGR